MNKRQLPEGFLEMAKKLPGIDNERFIEAMQGNPTVCVRINKRKRVPVFANAEKVKWNPNAFYLDFRPDFIFDPLFHAGAYYVQEASSTVYETLIEKIVKQTGGKALNVLDMCAAPGGKTTAMINALPDGSFVWANEVVEKRASVLKENLAKWGYPNVRITSHDTSYFADGNHTFDVVAVDAPCSGEGMMRKEEKAIEQWSPGLIEQCAALQRKILKNAVEALAPGGYLIYSTCTFNPLENEDNAQFVVNELGLQPVDPEFPKDWGIIKSMYGDYPFYRFMPHETKGEGLFLAVFKKEGELHPGITRMEEGKTGEVKGKKGRNKDKEKVKVGDKEGKEDVPIEKILSFDFNKTEYPGVDLSLEEAISYLRGEPLVLSEDVAKGIVIARYGGLALGAMKNIGPRANNLYPKPWRIRKAYEPSKQ